MTRDLTGACLAVMLALATGCNGIIADTRTGDGPAHNLAPVRNGNAFILTSDHLWQQNSDLLSLMARRVSSFRVQQTAGCPTIRMRGQTTYLASPDPVIYVDGTRAGNTCLLEMMRSPDVRRVEIYPGGVTQRPGYSTSPNGIILIFTRRGADDVV
jgi:hypothetical protein